MPFFNKHMSLGLHYSLISLYTRFFLLGKHFPTSVPYKPLILQHSTQTWSPLWCLSCSVLCFQSILIYVIIIPFIFTTELFCGRDLLYLSFYSYHTTQSLTSGKICSPLHSKCNVWMYRFLHLVTYNLSSVFHSRNLTFAFFSP